MKILLEEPTAIDALELDRLELTKFVGVHGFNAPEREIWEKAVAQSFKAFQALRYLGVKKKYAATVLPLAVVYRRRNRRAKRAVQANPVCIERRPDCNDSVDQGMGI